jgi:hypothetical protein
LKLVPDPNSVVDSDRVSQYFDHSKLRFRWAN